MRIRVLLTCLALCLAMAAVATSAQAATPVLPAQAAEQASMSVAVAGPPLEGALVSGGFMAEQPKGNKPDSGVSTLAALAGGCWYYGSPPGHLGGSVLVNDRFSCSASVPFIKASGCIHRYQPNNYVWYAVGCNASVGTGTALLTIVGVFQGCYTYEAWGAFSANGPFAYVAGPWVGPSRYLC